MWEMENLNNCLFVRVVVKQKGLLTNCLTKAYACQLLRLDIDLDFEDEETSKIYEWLRKKVVEAKWE